MWSFFDLLTFSLGNIVNYKYNKNAEHKRLNWIGQPHVAHCVFVSVCARKSKCVCGRT